MTRRIDNVQDLTPDLFWDILCENYKEQDDVVIPKINAISVTKVDQGVLSDVYRVHLDYQTADNEYENENETYPPPADWLAKFCRPDLDLSWMCRNETIFYQSFAPTLSKNGKKSLPFCIPRFLSGSDHHIILQQVQNITTHPLQEGCPPAKIAFLLKSLASWHAACWESDTLLRDESLVFPTGMGQRLAPLQKEGLFATSWSETIDHMRLRANDDEDLQLLEFATDLCQNLERKRLRDVHEQVHSHRVTCVHGDFHIANWLFPTCKVQQKPVLVDFATTGYGNPLVDFVFFLVVSTNDETVSDSKLVLEHYYDMLIEYDSTLESKISLQTLQEWFPWACLCQLLILVAYDGVCQSIAQAEEDPYKRETQLQHFYNTNRRMLLACKSIEDDWDSILSQLEPITPKEQEEARIFCERTPLRI